MTRHRAHQTRLWSTGLIIAALVATAGAAAPVAAAEAVPVQSVPVQSVPTADHACWADLDSGLSLCVGKGVDLVAAVAEEYGVYLRVPEGAIPDSSGSSVPQPAETRVAVSTVISVIYDNASYSGASYSLSSAGGCGYGYASLVPLGWNDRASSYRSYNGCSTALFANTNYTGSSTGYAANAAALGGMNNQASSWSVQ